MPRVPASVRRLAAMTAIAMAVTGVAARAMAVDSPGSSDGSSTLQVSAPTPDAAPAAPEPFPPISIQPLAPGTPVAPATTPTDGATQSMQQTLLLVINGGTISVLPTSANVVLHRDGDRHSVGQFGPITVIDARGSLAGWSLRASLAGPESGDLIVHPGTAVAITGRPGEATASGAAPLTTAGSVIMSAAPEGGGGDFSISGTVDLVGGNNDSDTVTVALAFAVS
jgi:hypothetical protein